MKIYGTLGPSCENIEIMKRMFREGMTGVRINMSHTSVEECRPMLERLQRAASECGIVPDILMDMHGPEIRVGDFTEPIEIWDGERIVLGEGGIPIPECVIHAAHPGNSILLDDGKILLTIVTSDNASIVADVERGGLLRPRKSIAMPGVRINTPCVTAEDLQNLREAASAGITGIMQPFVRGREDLTEVRTAMRECGAENLELFAKIENTDGVLKLSELTEEADWIVIARGDLGNAMELWELPGVQKEIAKVCTETKTPFIVVTQMLASMENNPVPTRAEVSDIFNAVLDGAAAVMVTGETAAGKYPAQVIRYLSKTANHAAEWRKEHEMPILQQR